MIYDSTLFTGAFTVSGCSSSKFNSDNFLQLNRESVSILDINYYDRSVLVPNSRIQSSLNSQMLAQEVPISGLGINDISYQINTGDFFIKGEDAPFDERNRFYYHDTTPISATSKILYNIVSGAGMIIATGDLGDSLKTSIDGAVGVDTPFTDLEYFLNGQKVYSGEGVGVKPATVTTPHFGVGTTYGGVVTTNNKNKFKYTAYQKRPKTLTITGVAPDVFGTGFVEKRTNFYINGMNELQSNYLELYTGVSIIKQGKHALISGGLRANEFEVISDSQSLVL